MAPPNNQLILSYSNNFSNLSAFIPGLAQFKPQNDWFVHRGPLGNILVGQSQPVYTSPPSVNLVSGGALLEVNKDSGAPEDGTYSPSRALYIVKPANTFTLGLGQTLTLSVNFDRPKVNTTGMMPPKGANALDYAWGMALVLKTGDQNEKGDGSETRLRTSCQFFSGGLVHFHGTDYKKEPKNPDPFYEQDLVSIKSYGDYRTTDFWLTIALSRTIAGGKTTAIPVLSGTGTFDIGPDRFTGNLNNVVSTDDLSWLTGVGFSLVSMKNRLPSISLRVKSFSVTLT